MPWNLQGIKSWSLYYNSTRGQVAPIDSIAFSETDNGSIGSVTITVNASYKSKGKTTQLSQSKTVCMRNFIPDD